MNKLLLSILILSSMTPLLFFVTRNQRAAPMLNDKKKIMKIILKYAQIRDVKKYWKNVLERDIVPNVVLIYSMIIENVVMIHINVVSHAF